MRNPELSPPDLLDLNSLAISFLSLIKFLGLLDIISGLMRVGTTFPQAKKEVLIMTIFQFSNSFIFPFKNERDYILSEGRGGAVQTSPFNY